MSRDASGNYSLPAGNPVQSGTTVEASWANTTLSDVATSLTNSLDRTGKGGMTGQMKAADGSLATPGISFNNEVGTGWFRSGAGTIRMSIEGVLAFETSSGLLEIQKADNGAAPGPVYRLYRTSTSPEGDDFIGEIVLDGQDSGANQTTYAKVSAQIASPVDGAEAGRLGMYVMLAGALTKVLEFDETGAANFTFDVNAPNMGAGSSGGLATDATVRTSTFTAISNRRYYCDSTAGGFTFDLPATAPQGSLVAVVDYAKTFAINNVVIGRNGANIENVAEDLTLDINGGGVVLQYFDATTGWRLV